MSLASDLMGFGVAPLQAARTATAGIGPVTATAAANATVTGATKIGATQYLTSWTVPSATVNSCVLPGTGETGALIGDDYIIHNGTTTVTLFVFPPSGFTMNVVGAQYTVSAAFPVVGFHTLTCWYVSSSQMFGVYA